MSTGDRCSRCSDCSCSRCSENGTGDSESLKSSLFCTCIEQPATATPATAATPRKGQRPALQTIGSQRPANHSDATHNKPAAPAACQCGNRKEDEMNAKTKMEMGRKIIQIAAAMGGNPGDPDMVTGALCDDGTVWPSWNGDKWHPMPAIPQPTRNTGAQRAA